MLQRIFLSICLVASASLSISPFANAVTSLKDEERPRVAKNEVVDGTVIATGDDIVIEGSVHGDIICAGKSVTISGRVEGDIMCAGSTIKISGPVLGDVRVAGSSIEIANEVGNVTALGDTVTFTPMARVGRDIILAAQNVNVESHTGRDIFGAVKNLTLSSTVGGHVRVWGDAVTLRTSAVIAGSLIYTSPNSAVIEKANAVKGQVDHIQPAVTNPVARSAMTQLLFSLFWFVSMALLGGVLLMLHPRLLLLTSARIHGKLWASVGWGVVGLIGVPMVALVAMVTFVGVPLGVFILLVWLVALLLAQLLAAHALGLWLLQKFQVAMAMRLQYFLSLLIGLLILALLGVIPVVGPLVSFVALLAGLGSLATYFSGRKPAEKEIV